MIDFIKYLNLGESIFQFNAWKTDLSFPLNSCSEIERKILGELMVKEWIFPGKYRELKDAEDLYADYLSGTKDIIYNKDDNRSKFLFCAEQRSKIKSRLRSYKGIVDKKLLVPCDYFEHEFFIDQNETLFAAIIELTNESYFDFVKTVFFDDSVSFVITGDEFLPIEDMLNKIFTECLTVSGNVQINYLKLAINFCMDGKRIYRAGGDGGDDYWSIQCFTRKGD